jgi:hypothetical protein
MTLAVDAVGSGSSGFSPARYHPDSISTSAQA